MAASDARWPPLKNAAWRVTFPLLDADGDLVPGGASDTPDSERSIDNGTFADCSNEFVEVATNSGMYYLDLNASEMNGDCIAIICKTATAGTKTTPIVVYPVSGGFNELVTDHDKTQSDIALIDAAIDSDALLADADHDKTQSDIALLSAKADSDQTLNLADHDKTQSDIALIDAAIDSDHTITISDIATVNTKIDSDVVVLDAKLDSDMTLLLADHDKTQSDIALVDAAIDSDALLADADHDKTQSDIALLSAKADSDQTLNLADHDKTQSDVAAVYSDTTLMAGTGGVELGTSQTAAWASQLEASAGQIIEATVDTAVNGHTPTTTEFQADDVTEATADHFNGRIVIFTSGVLAGQATDITDYVAVGGIGQFTVTAMTEAPANNDTFVIV
jgi:hypothetical protein